MWDAGPDYPHLIAGDHEISTTATAWYAGTHLADLHIDPEGAVRHDFYDGNDVRRTIENLTIITPDGALVPRKVTDPLAPFGQKIVVRQQISAARRQVIADYPLGEYLITQPEAEAGWRHYKNTWIPTGGTVTITAIDRWEIVERSSLIGLWQAAPSTPIENEVRRLLRGTMPLVGSGLSAGIPASKAVHSENAGDAIRSILDIVNRVPHVDRMGRLAPLPRTPATGGPDEWAIWLENTTQLGPIPTLSDDDIYNQVAATGESDDLDAEILAIANERGRLGPGSQFGWRTYQHHSPLYRTRAAADTGAHTILNRLIRDRTITYRVTVPFDPCRDVLDPVAVSLTPRTRGGTSGRVGVVVGIRHQLTGGEMEVDIAVPLTEVDF